MAYRMNAYDADIFIPEFKGLMQYGDEIDADIQYSPDCHDTETPGGVLQPVPNNLNKGFRLVYNGSDVFFNATATRAGNRRIVTMMSTYAKNISSMPWGTDDITIEKTDGSSYTISGQIMPGEYYYLYVFAIYDELYEARFRDSIAKYALEEGFSSSEIKVRRLATNMGVRGWSWCTYEHTFTRQRPSEPEGTTNVIIMSSPAKGVYIYNGITLNEISAPCKFQYITRFAERIWGVGTVDDKNSIYYSRAFNAFSWSASTEIPEDGGGEIREPTFDDDSFVGLKPFGASLIAFTKKRAWRITGTDPSNFVIQEQYGNGTKHPDTISVIGDYILMLGETGLVTYDGNSVSPFMQECLHELMREENVRGYGYELPKNIAFRTKNKYVLCMSNGVNIIQGSYDLHTEYYNAYIYDITDRTFNRIGLPLIVSACEESEATYFVSTDARGHVEVHQFLEDSWHLQCPVNVIEWQTPWIALGRKDIKKGGFDVYFQPEIGGVGSDKYVDFKFTIKTEKKAKSKTYRASGLTAEQVMAGKEYKQKKLHFGGSGRRFKLIIQTMGGNTYWRLVGGIHIIAEIDKD